MFRKQKSINDLYEEMLKSIKNFEVAIKAQTDFRIYTLVGKNRFNKAEDNFRQIAYSDMVIDIIDERTINVIKSRYFEQGIYVKEKRKFEELSDTEV